MLFFLICFAEAEPNKNDSPIRILFGNTPLESKKEALSKISSDLTDNGNTSYGFQDFGYIIPHINDLINIMSTEDFFFPVYHILTREYGVSCHIELTNEQKQTVINAINGLKVNSAYMLHDFMTHKQEC